MRRFTSRPLGQATKAEAVGFCGLLLLSSGSSGPEADVSATNGAASAKAKASRKRRAARMQKEPAD